MPALHPRLAIVDRPGSQQSIILAATRVPADATGGSAAFDAAASHIRRELIEGRGWTYNTASGSRRVGAVIVRWVIAPVQADRTASAMAIMRDALLPTKPTASAVPPDTQWRRYADSRSILGNFLSTARGPGYPARDPDSAGTAQSEDIAAPLWVVVGDRQDILRQLGPTAARYGRHIRWRHTRAPRPGSLRINAQSPYEVKLPAVITGSVRGE